MSDNFNVSVELTKIHCGECGGTYAISERYRKQKYESGGSWNCPYCRCGWGYSENNENSKLKHQVEQLKKQKAQEQERALRNEHKYNCTKKQYKKVRDRIKHGVCPCCNRQIKQLAAHMKAMHPDFGEEKQIKTLRLAYGLTQADLADEAGVEPSHISAYENNRACAEWARIGIENWLKSEAR